MQNPSMTWRQVMCLLLQIIRRSGPTEKALVLTRARNGHHCDHAVMIVGICLWDGIHQDLASEVYDYLRNVLPTDGEPTERRCGWNERLVSIYSHSY
jgi:hypothetical protein